MKLLIQTLFVASTVLSASTAFAASGGLADRINEVRTYPGTSVGEASKSGADQGRMGKSDDMPMSMEGMKMKMEMEMGEMKEMMASCKQMMKESAPQKDDGSKS